MTDITSGGSTEPWTVAHLKELDAALGQPLKTDEQYQQEVDAQHNYVYEQFAQRYYPLSVS